MINFVTFFKLTGNLTTKFYRLSSTASSIHYIQGQVSSTGAREYFYFIDHQGQLFLDDARMKNFTSCFKDKAFLQFFFKRLKFNDIESSPYSKKFPLVSPCGPELNFVWCDDLPYVITSFLPGSDDKTVVLNNCGEWYTFPFDPSSLFMLPDSGRLYHTAPKRVGGVALVKSALAIDLSGNFVYKNKSLTPHAIMWKGSKVTLNQTIQVDLEKLYKKIRRT